MNYFGLAHAGSPFSSQAGNALSLPFILPSIINIGPQIEAKVDDFKGELSGNPCHARILQLSAGAVQRHALMQSDVREGHLCLQSLQHPDVAKLPVLAVTILLL